jgi:hypothetical protein
MIDAGRTLCATGSRRYAKRLINFIQIETEKIKLATAQKFLKFFMLIKFDDWEEECEV